MWDEVGDSGQYQLAATPFTIINSGRLAVAGADVATLKSGPAEPQRAPRAAEAKKQEEIKKKQRCYEIGSTARGCAMRVCT